MSMSFSIRRIAAGLAAALLLPTMAVAQLDPTSPAAQPANEAAQDEEEFLPDPPPDGVHPLTKADVDAWLDGFMPYALERLDIVGGVVAVVKDGEILTSRGYGYADLETRKPMDPASTLVRPGSVSKLFTWTAIMQLVEQGEVDLDTDVNAYLDFKIPDAFGAPVTVRHLLTHTPGFEEAIKHIMVEDVETFLPLDEYLKSSIPERVFPPGEIPAYSNYATALAGYIVARVSGMSFDDYIDANIFAPLGMTQSSFRQPLPEALAPDMSSGYQDAADGEAKYFEMVTPAPAGSLSATADDMARFMIAHLNNGGPLLKPETAREMHTTIDPKAPPLHGMALGFYQQDIHGLRSIGHGGDTVFFHSDLRLFLDKNVGVFVSVNSGGNAGLGTLMLRERLSANFAQRYFPEARADFEERLETAKEHGARVAGVYESSRASVKNFFTMTRFLGQMKVTVDEKGDVLTPLGATPWRWREVEPFVWRRVGGHERLTAVFAEDGSVEMLTFEPLSPFTVFTPPPWYRNSAILTPLLIAAQIALVATLLLWPIRAAVRWRYKTRFALEGRSALAYRVARIGVLLIVGYLAAWGVGITVAGSDITKLSSAMDPTFRALQFAQPLLYLGAAAVLWNLVQNWADRRSWFAMLWSLVLALSVVVFVWFAAIAGLLSFDLTY